MTFSRRTFLTSAASLSALTLAPMPTFAAPRPDARFVFYFLRGGMDGLVAAHPLGDPAYASARALFARPADELLQLDSTFYLASELPTIKSLYDAGEATVFHAIGSSYGDRSHFDAQQMMELSNGALFGTDGFLGRVATVTATSPEEVRAVSLGQLGTQLALMGTSNATGWTNSWLEPMEQETQEFLRTSYATDMRLQAAVTRVQQTQDIVAQVDFDSLPEEGGSGVLESAAAGIFLSSDVGPRIAMIDIGGWDTHADQTAQMPELFGSLDASIAALRSSLGNHWANTVVFVISEFGRTVIAEGSTGTDHGTGGVAFMAGGAVNGGRVIADWPGIAPHQLFEERDVRTTTDFRAVLKGVFGDHMGISSADLETVIFPDSSGVTAMQDLIRA